ncbi:MAG: hypothetical protein ACO2PK_05925, partial [Armatimonadota bacterium]
PHCVSPPSRFPAGRPARRFCRGCRLPSWLIATPTVNLRLTNRQSPFAVVIRRGCLGRTAVYPDYSPVASRYSLPFDQSPVANRQSLLAAVLTSLQGR